MNDYKRFTMTCDCGRLTTKKYAREHGNKCKVCFTGIQPRAKESKPPGGFQDWGEYRMSAEYKAEVSGQNDLSPDY